MITVLLIGLTIACMVMMANNGIRKTELAAQRAAFKHIDGLNTAAMVKLQELIDAGTTIDPLAVSDVIGILQGEEQETNGTDGN